MIFTEKIVVRQSSGKVMQSGKVMYNGVLSHPKDGIMEIICGNENCLPEWGAKRRARVAFFYLGKTFASQLHPSF